MRMLLGVCCIIIGSITAVLPGTVPLDDNDELPSDTEPANSDWTPINLWPGGIVPYDLPDDMYTSTQRGIIMSAMRRWEAKTCVKFVPWTDDLKAEYREDRYIKFFSAGSCFSKNGMDRNQPQLLGIGRGCLKIPTVIHELGHSLGFVHTMERSDRDVYIRINYDNMNNDSVLNFAKTDDKKIIYPLFGTPYDYKSIMHYGPKSWSVNGEPVTLTLDPAYQNVIGRALDVSFFDALYVNTAYNCSARCSTSLAGLCRNGGFLGGSDCRCICHDGYVGQFCDQTLTGVVTVVDWRCSKGWVFEAGRCHLFNTKNNVTYSRANLECSGQKSSLVTFKTRPDMERISRMTREAIMTSGKSKFWVGARREAGKTETKWVDNSLVDTNLVSLVDKSVPEKAGCAEFNGESMILRDCETASPDTGYICQKKFDADCGGRYVLDKSAVTIQSPGFPKSYENNLECQYVIQAKAGSQIRLTFPVFMLQSRCKNDYLEVQLTDDITTPGKRYCYNDLRGKELVSEGNLAVITFKTNNRITSSGFQATLEPVTSQDGDTSTGSPFAFLDSIREVFQNVDNSEGPSDGEGNWSLQAFIDLIKSMTFVKIL